jgi:hypothetical protein
MAPATVLFPLAALLRLASRLICLVVTVSFVIFVVNQAGSASTHQQNAVNGAVASGATSAPNVSGQVKRKGTVHRTIDEIAEVFTSPFAGITGSTSQWAVRGVGTLVALIVYGIGLGYLARVLHIRV